MAVEERWGVGNAADAKGFRTVKVGDPDGRGTLVELLHGEHPHSRRDNTTYARLPGGAIQGFSGHMLRRKVVIEEYNRFKESHYSGDEIRGGCRVQIFFDDFPAYEFFCNDTAWGFARAQVLMVELLESGPDEFWTPEGRQRLIGRKVYWRDQPGIITSVFADQGAVMIAPDGKEAFNPPAYELEEDGPSFWEPGPIKEDILSRQIWWFRKDA